MGWSSCKGVHSGNLPTNDLLDGLALVLTCHLPLNLTKSLSALKAVLGSEHPTPLLGKVLGSIFDELSTELTTFEACSLANSSSDFSGSDSSCVSISSSFLRNPKYQTPSANKANAPPITNPLVVFELLAHHPFFTAVSVTVSVISNARYQ